MPDRADRRLKAFECKFNDTGLCPWPPANPELSPPKYFRVRDLAEVLNSLCLKLYNYTG
jgi:hypothetical protein